MNFEAFKAKASEVLDTVAGAASRAAGAAKASVSVYAEEEKIKTAYQAIGKLYFADCKAGTPVSGPAYDEQMEKIAAALARIDELKARNSVVPAEEPVEEPAAEEAASEEDTSEEVTPVEEAVAEEEPAAEAGAAPEEAPVNDSAD